MCALKELDIELEAVRVHQQRVENKHSMVIPRSNELHIVSSGAFKKMGPLILDRNNHCFISLGFLERALESLFKMRNLFIFFLYLLLEISLHLSY